MAMMQSCAAVARRAIMTARQPLLTSPMSSLLSGSFASSSTEVHAPALPILCGRGDKRTRKGKRFKGSYGKARPKKEKKIERIKDRVEVPRSTPWPLPFKLI